LYFIRRVYFGFFCRVKQICEDGDHKEERSSFKLPSALADGQAAPKQPALAEQKIGLKPYRYWYPNRRLKPTAI
jgi:hypothetical protein